MHTCSVCAIRKQSLPGGLNSLALPKTRFKLYQKSCTSGGKSNLSSVRFSHRVHVQLRLTLEDLDQNINGLENNLRAQHFVGLENHNGWAAVLVLRQGFYMLAQN